MNIPLPTGEGWAPVGLAEWEGEGRAPRHSPERLAFEVPSQPSPSRTDLRFAPVCGARPSPEGRGR